MAKPDPRFTDNGDGTLLDNLTGLTWMKDMTAPGEMTWSQALDYAAQLNSQAYLGRTNWVVPNSTQLLSLAEFSGNTLLPSASGPTEAQSPLIKGPFTSTPYETWTATTFMLSSMLNYAETVKFLINSRGIKGEKMKNGGGVYVVATAVPPEPNISVDRMSATFDAPLGEADSEEIWVTNTGEAGLALTGISFWPWDFAYNPSTIGGCELPITLSPGTSCIVEVIFRPTTAGWIEGELGICSNDPDTPVVRITLTGQGLD